jgi:DNA-directed RNA polymerase specialized sigma24 family protein
MSASELRTLVEWLDEDAREVEPGEAYVTMHARLVAYFARKGCHAPEDLADDTLTRVSRRLREEGSITGVAPAQFCYITARYVFLEYLRNPERGRTALLRDVADRPASTDEAREWVMRCLDVCLDRLDAQERALILEYYAGSQQERIPARRNLAARLGLTANAVAIRASRIREGLRACVGRCAGGRRHGTDGFVS